MHRIVVVLEERFHIEYPIDKSHSLLWNQKTTNLLEVVQVKLVEESFPKVLEEQSLPRIDY
jgi:hypothetical protein